MLAAVLAVLTFPALAHDKNDECITVGQYYHLIDRVLVKDQKHSRVDYTGEDAEFLRDHYNNARPITNVKADMVTFISANSNLVPVAIAVFSVDDCVTHIKLMPRSGYDMLMDELKKRGGKQKILFRGKKRDA